MNKGLLSRLKQRILPALADQGATGSLTNEQHRTMHALLIELADDETVSPERVRRFIESRTQATQGLRDEFTRGARLLDDVSRRMSGAAAWRFVDLPRVDRQVALARILRSYPHPLNESRLRRRLKVVSDNLDLVVSKPAVRRFRDYVVRTLLTHYYSSAEGWALVGYTEYPGRVRSEWERCEVRAIHVEPGALMLELSDGCFEPLKPSALEPDETTELAIRTKSGRQRAVFSRTAYLALAEHIESTDDGLLLAIGEHKYPILR